MAGVGFFVNRPPRDPRRNVAADDLLEAAARYPSWRREPAPEERAAWHAANPGGVCDNPWCEGNPCRCHPFSDAVHESTEPAVVTLVRRARHFVSRLRVDPEVDREMRRREQSTRERYRHLRRVYDRHKHALDPLDHRIGELLEDPWLPNRDREELIRVLGALKHGAGEELSDSPKLTWSEPYVDARSRKPAVNVMLGDVTITIRGEQQVRVFRRVAEAEGNLVPWKVFVQQDLEQAGRELEDRRDTTRRGRPDSGDGLDADHGFQVPALTPKRYQVAGTRVRDALREAFPESSCKWLHESGGARLVVK